MAISNDSIGGKSLFSVFAGIFLYSLPTFGSLVKARRESIR